VAAPTGASELLNRNSEREHLDALFADVRARAAGPSWCSEGRLARQDGAVRCDARQAVDVRTAQIAGMEAEMELPYAGIHRLCAPMLGRLDALQIGLASQRVVERREPLRRRTVRRATS